MKKHTINLLLSSLFIFTATLSTPAFAEGLVSEKTIGTDGTMTTTARSSSGASNMSIVAQKVRADKKFLVSQNMTLTDTEAQAFWPIYETYQSDLQKLNNRLAKVIVAYAEAYNAGPVPDVTAKKLLNESLSIDAAETKLKQSYVPKLSKALPAAKVARYIQIEGKLRAIVRYELADQIPLVE